METVCIKLEGGILSKVDVALKQDNYSTRTEFVREAIRDKLKQLEKERILLRLESGLGGVNQKVSEERHEQVREEVAQEYARKLGVKLD